MLRGCLVIFALATLGLGACNGNGGDDGGDDAPGGGGCSIDPNFDNESCGDQISFTGELVDWDNDTAFCGVYDALFQVQGDGAMSITGPNGRFSLCAPDQATTLLDVMPAPDNSQCTTPPSPYPLPGIAVARRDVIRAGAFFSVRTFTAARRDSFFAEAGFQFAPALAQVLVHVHGTPRAVSIAAGHAPVHAVADRTWAPGDTGHEVFFPNVDPGGGATMLTVAGGATGTGSIPLVAGTFTYVTVCAR